MEIVLVGLDFNVEPVDMASAGGVFAGRSQANDGKREEDRLKLIVLGERKLTNDGISRDFISSERQLENHAACVSRMLPLPDYAILEELQIAVMDFIYFWDVVQKFNQLLKHIGLNGFHKTFSEVRTLVVAFHFHHVAPLPS